MSEDEKKFMEECDSFKEGGSVDEYKAEIVKYLTLCSWHYSEDDAKELVEDEASYIEEAFEKKEPVSDIALDIGYSCG